MKNAILSLYLLIGRMLCLLKDQFYDFEGAATISAKLVSDHPSYKCWYYTNYAEILIRQGKFLEADSVFLSGIAIWSNVHEFYQYRSYNLRDNLGQFGKSAEVMDQAITLHPNLWYFWADKAYSLRLDGRQAEALEVYNAAELKFATISEIYQWKADCLSELYRYQEAYETRKKASNLMEYRYHLDRDAAYHLLADDSFSQALNLFNLLVIKFPGLYSMYVGKAETLFRMNRFEDSAVEFSNAISIRSNIWELYHRKAMALISAGKFNDAVDTYDRAITKFTTVYQLKFFKAQALHAIQEYDKALELINLLPTQKWEYENEKVIILFNSHKFSDSLTFIESLLINKYTTNCKNCRYQLNLYKSQCLFRLNHIDETLIKINETIAIIPEKKNAVLMREEFLFKINSNANNGTNLTYDPTIEATYIFQRFGLFEKTSQKTYYFDKFSTYEILKDGLYSKETGEVYNESQLSIYNTSKSNVFDKSYEGYDPNKYQVVPKNETYEVYNPKEYRIILKNETSTNPMYTLQCNSTNGSEIVVGFLIGAIILLILILLVVLYMYYLLKQQKMKPVIRTDEDPPMNEGVRN